jgi:hypothetical protein
MHGTLRRQHIGRPARARRLREISKETHGILLKAHTGDGETEAFTIDFASIEFNYNPIAEDELETNAAIGVQGHRDGSCGLARSTPMSRWRQMATK